ncbi:MAG: hypothetical protein ABI702_15905 [Burkholderiales bacterium]
MSDRNAIASGLDALVVEFQRLQPQAAQQPVVNELLRTGTRDVQQIEHTLDGLLDVCGYGPVLEMYRRLCRHYWDVSARRFATCRPAPHFSVTFFAGGGHSDQ